VCCAVKHLSVECLAVVKHLSVECLAVSAQCVAVWVFGSKRIVLHCCARAASVVRCGEVKCDARCSMSMCSEKECVALFHTCCVEGVALVLWIWLLQIKIDSVGL